MSENEKIIRIIDRFFEVGNTKNFEELRELQLDDHRFSSFSDVPPYDLKDYSTTITLEELRFASISDFQHQIKNPKISVFGDFAIVAFELVQKGMLVDNKAFTGEHIVIEARATFVLYRKEDWKIVHIHLSKKNN